MNSKTLKTYNIIFYSLVAAAFLFILLSNPFLKLPYDPWDNLLRIVSLHDEGKCFYFWPGYGCTNRILWHEIWAKVFKIIGINDIFIWAKIIHVFQFFIAGICLYYFSKTALTILIKSPLTPLLQRGDEKGSATSPLEKKDDVDSETPVLGKRGDMAESPTLNKKDDMGIESPTLKKGDLGGFLGGIPNPP
jgi:hypothetical protein